MHEEVVRVQFGDTDCTTRVYFPVYVKWIDNAIIEMLRKHGLTFDRNGILVYNGERLGITFVIGEYWCRMEKPSYYDDTMLLKVWVKEVRSKVSKYEGVFLNPEDNTILARGGLTYVCIDINTSKSTEIPDNIKKILESEVLDREG